MRKLAFVAVGVLVLAGFTAAPALGRDPTPTGTKRNFHGNDPVTYQRANGTGPWFQTAVDEGLEDNFHSSVGGNTEIPALDHDGSGTGLVNYKTASTSPCGTGSTAWIQCAKNDYADENWTIYVRNLTSGGPANWYWWEESSGCHGHSGTCWYLRRAIIHEAGHAMYAFPDLENANELNTVMNGHDPSLNEPGNTPFLYRRCDEAGAQLVWDLGTKAGEYGDCFDNISNAGPTGLKTNVDPELAAYYGCNGSPVTVSGRLEVKDVASYKVLGGNTLAGRTVWFDRNSTLKFTSTTATTGQGSNWSVQLNGSNAMYTYVAHFDHSGADGLSDSNTPSFTITFFHEC